MLFQIQSYVRSLITQHRDVLRVGPFLATFDRHSANPYLSYAVPDAGAAPTSAEVDALVTAYHQRQRPARLEYLPDLAPAVEPALLAAGFTVELRTAVLTLAPGAAVPHRPPAGIEIAVPGDVADLVDLVRVQRAAFGGDPSEVDAEDVAALLGDDGTITLFARDTATGAVVGAGSATAVLDGVSELVGIAVAPAYRRRGIATALTWRLTDLVSRAGADVPFLTPGDDAADRVYRAVGYRPTGDMLHLSSP